MNDPRWNDIERIYFAALELAPEERESYVAQACAHDEGLGREIRSLLGVTGDEHLLSIERNLLADEEPALDRTGETISGYRLAERIGQGGMGEVYRAERMGGEFSQVVALKLLRPEHRSTEAIRRFRTERHILAQLEHPAIVPILDGGVDDTEQPWFVMPLVQGVPITAFVRRDGLDVRARVRLFLRVCEAVQYAHRNLIVHRDLKPSNIIVDEDGAPRLLDFGIAKLLDTGRNGGDTAPGSIAETRTGMWLMTPDYAAPEQVLEQRPTTSVDIYALGVLLYELLSGQNPQASDEHPRTEQLRRVCELDPPPPSRIATGPDRAQIEGDLDTIVLMAVRKEPERRYSTVTEFAEDLGRWLDALPVRARPNTLQYRATRFVQRNRTSVTVAVLLLTGLLAFAALSARQTVVLREQRDRVELERDRAQHVVDLLAELFRTTDPKAHPGGDTLRVTQFLELSEAKVLRELEAEPLLQAEMQHVLGVVHRNRSSFESARNLLESAFRAQLDREGWENDRTLTFFHEFAVLEKDLGAGDADSLLRRSLDLRRNRYGEESLPVAQACIDLAGAVYDLDEALALAERGVRLRRRLAPTDSLALAEAINSEGVQHFRRSDWDSAIQSFGAASTLAVRKLGDDDPVSLEYLGNLSTTLANDPSQLGRAEEIERRVLTARRRIFGENSQVVATNLNNLGSLLVLQRKTERARPVYEQALAIYETLFGDRHELIAITLRNLATIAILDGDFDGAHRIAEECVAACPSSMPLDSPTYVFYELVPAWVRFEEGEIAAALAEFQRMQDKLEATAPESPMAAGLESLIGVSLLELGRAEQAESHLRRAESIREQVPTIPALRAESQLLLGLVELARGDTSSATPRMEANLEAYRAWVLASPRILRLAEAASAERDASSGSH